jgi:Tfp pilus assembly protein PilN
MRPVNLIPPEERRDKAAVRTGPIAYMLVGALVLVLGAVTMLVMTSNKISDRKSQVADLQQRVDATQSQATQYASFTQFAGIVRSRHSTIKSLADSRFDWQRVLEEMARVIPADVSISKLTATSSAGAAGASADPTSDPSAISGPSLDITGCASGQDAVARFIAALRDIDGLTRVGLTKSDLPESSPSGSSDSAGASGDCPADSFELLAAFDAVPAPPVAGAAPATTTAAPATTDGSDSSSTDSSTTPATDSGT